jgi:hypothetical protein
MGTDGGIYKNFSAGDKHALPSLRESCPEGAPPPGKALPFSNAPPPGNTPFLQAKFRLGNASLPGYAQGFPQLLITLKRRQGATLSKSKSFYKSFNVFISPKGI